jgi:NADH-quinone oxidoreductase subunit C
MNKKNLIDELRLTFADIQVNEDDDGMIKIHAKKEQVKTILRYLKGNGYDHLALVSCVDWINKKEFELIYILTSYLNDNKSYQEKGDVYLKIRVTRDAPEVETVIGVFENAEPYEREIHELFGINFRGHPRLISLFLEREYDVPPFRKDFDTRKYVEDFFNSIPVVPEEKA